MTVEGSVSVNVTDLTPGSDYQLRVTAVSNDGQMSPPSNTITATTLFSGEIYSFSVDIHISPVKLI